MSAIVEVVGIGAERVVLDEEGLRESVLLLHHRVEVVAEAEVERQPIGRTPRVLDEANQIVLLRREHRRIERDLDGCRTIVDEVVDAVVGDFGAAQELELRLDVAILESTLHRVRAARPRHRVHERNRTRVEERPDG